MVFLPFLLAMGGCVYVEWHVWQILPLDNVWKTVCLALLTLPFLSLFFYFRSGLDTLSYTSARVVYALTTSSIFFLLYLSMIFLVLDLGRLVHLVPPSFLHHSLPGTLTVIGLMAVIFTWGNMNYHHKVRVPISLVTEKPLLRPLRIIMISDLHLGYANGRKSFSDWVTIINGEKPDLVLVGGDVIDNSIRPLEHENIANEFQKIKAPVYACLGNHEYYAGKEESKKFYEQAGIKLLVDSSAVFEDNIVIIGRDDRANGSRKSLSELMEPADKSRYAILLDHQPYHLEEAEKEQIDFQFSGHTHYGQVWPISKIEDMIYEKAYGELTKGQTKYYVSSGLGIWGGKYRIGTQSEYVVVTLENK